MRIARIYLRNYRVFEEELDLEVPPGLVGIYGPNGAGKSYLVESVLWTLWGHTRTDKDEVRTAGVNADCVTEVEFEHEGHLYLVRRSIKGINDTVKATAEADGTQVADGVQSVKDYVHSVLGMDAAAFRASVFAEQKQVASFSGLRPSERKDLVLRLLGITPLDRARDDARRDARGAIATHDQLRRVLPDLDGLEAAAADSAAKAAAMAAEAESEQAAAATAADKLAAAEARLATLDAVGREHDALVAEGRVLRAEHDAAAARAVQLAAELAELDVLGERVARLELLAARQVEAERELQLLEEAAKAAEALAAVPDPAPPPEPDEEEAARTRAEAEEAAGAVAGVAGLLQGARAELDRAEDAVARSDALSPEGECPVCGQALGAAFEQVQTHRNHELDEARRRVVALEDRHRGLEARARGAKAAAAAAASALVQAQRAWAAYEKLRDRRAALQEAVDHVCRRLGRVPAGDEIGERRREVGRLREAGAELQRAVGRLERRAGVEQELQAARAVAGETGGRVEALREKVHSLAFRPEDLAAARTGYEEHRRLAERARNAAHQAGLVAERAAAEAEAAATALGRGQRQHAALAAAADEARHLGRVAELLSAFRDTVVATVGPRLSSHAAELFGELTDHEYDRLEVDPLSYEIQIRDGGRLFGMDRFSGSETDLANLALRVAISEHVRLLSGGAVGLLVLDEVFGPLDDGRKARMLAALERLKGRFRQILVVTHDNDIKAELPNAIEVVKLPGRRATARSLSV